MHIGICPFEYEKRKVQKTKQSPNLVTNDYAHLNMKIWIWKNKVKKTQQSSIERFFLRRWNIERRTLNVERPYILLFFLHLMKADIVGYVI